MARRLGRIIDAERPDVVNTHNIQGFSSAVWGAVDRRKIPLVQTLHDYYTGCVNSSMFRSGRNCDAVCARCRILGAPRRHYSRKPQVVTTVSLRLFSRLHAAGIYAGLSDVRVIHNGNLEPPPLRRRLGPAPGTPLRLGFLGRLEPVKGLDLMLDVVSKFAPEQVVAVIGGRGDPGYEESLRQRFAGPQVTFRGWVDPYSFFEEIDLLVVPSIWEEPLSRVSHEAMACGVPVLGSRTGGIPEIVHQGESGFLFRAGDPLDLERVLAELIANPPDWGALSDHCGRHSRRFDMGVIFQQYWSAWNAAVTSVKP